MTLRTGSILIRNVFSLISARLISRILQFFLFIFAARVLGVEKFGIFSYAFAFAAMVTVLMDLGISRYAVQQTSRVPEKIPKFMGASFSVKFFLIITGLGLITLIGPIFQKEPDTFYVLIILGSAVALDNLTIVFSSVFQAKERMEYQSVIIIISNTIMSATGFILLFLFPEVTVYSLVFLFGAGLRFLLSGWWCIKKYGRPEWISDTGFHTDLLKKGAPFALVTIFVSIYYNIDTFLLTVYSGKEIVGYYNASYRLIEAPLFLISAITTALFPTASRLFSDNKEDLINLIKTVIKPVILLGLSISIVTAFFSLEIITIIYGDEYHMAAIVLPVLIFSVSIIMPNAILGTTIRAMDRQSVSAWLAGIGALLNVVMNLIVIPRYSFLGAAWTTLITEVFILTVSFILVRRYIGIFLSIGDVIRISIFAGVLGGFLFLTEFIGCLWIQIAGYLLFIFPMLFVLRFVDWAELQALFYRYFSSQRIGP